jgi:hypothetical protein
VGLRGRLRRLEREAEGEMVFVPQEDGAVKRFPQSALQEAFVTNMRRLRGEEVPPHPLGVAAAGSPDPGWVEPVLLLRSVDGDRRPRRGPQRALRGVRSPHDGRGRAG